MSVDNEIRVWAQMFFDDGSVTQGKYIPHTILNNIDSIQAIILEFLDETGRKEGVILIWGAGHIYGRRARLLLRRSGPLKGSETLRLTNL
jgi:hypothetical protein